MNPVTVQPSSRHKNSLAATLSRIGIGDDSELHFYLTIMLHPAQPEGGDEKVRVDPPTAILTEADFISALKLLYPQPAVVTSTDDKPPVALSTLKPGSIFERGDGGRFVKGRFRDGTTRYCCIGLTNGDEARVSGEEMVRETVTFAKADRFEDWLKTVLGEPFKLPQA